MFTRRFRHIPNVLRLAAFGAVVSTGVVALSVRAAARNVDEGLLSLGAQMMRYADQRTLAAARRMEINGAQIEFATGNTRDPVHTVLDYYQARCTAHSGALAEQIEALVATHPGGRSRALASLPANLPSHTTIRHEVQDQGYVACLDVGATRLTSEETLRRLQSFVRTGNLADVGRMRYLYASHTQRSGTHLVGIWSDSDVNVYRMFPTTGDAPGNDPVDVPRAPGLRRVLSAREVGPAYGMSIFAGNAPRTVIEQHYRRELPRHGWTYIAARGPQGDLDGQTLLTYEKGASSVSLVIDDRDGQTTVTALQGL